MAIQPIICRVYGELDGLFRGAHWRVCTSSQAVRCPGAHLAAAGPVIASIPMMTERGGVPSAGFWIFDQSLVALETPTASIEVTRPEEVDLYVRMFEHLRGASLGGAGARSLIIRTLGDLTRGCVMGVSHRRFRRLAW